MFFELESTKSFLRIHNTGETFLPFFFSSTVTLPFILLMHAPLPFPFLFIMTCVACHTTFSFAPKPEIFKRGPSTKFLPITNIFLLSTGVRHGRRTLMDCKTGCWTDSAGWTFGFPRLGFKKTFCFLLLFFSFQPSLSIKK